MFRAFKSKQTGRSYFQIGLEQTQLIKMAYRRDIPAEKRAYVRYLREKERLTLQEIAEICNISTSSVQRITTQALPDVLKKKRSAGGRKRKLSPRYERLILRSIPVLREREGSFTSKRLMLFNGIRFVSDRTVRRLLNRNGYHYLQARKKGLMSRSDRTKRVAFARNVLNNYPADIWTSKIAFYLDGVSFVHKTNPMDQARAPRGRVWRKASEGLKQGCLAKGSKTGTGGKLVKMIVAISYNKGVIICEQYDRMCGAFFEGFIDEHFESMFQTAGKGESRMFLMDGDPSQNSARAKAAMSRVGCQLFHIPPRSPELNGCENLFNIAADKLRKDALERAITRESYEQFRDRVRETIEAIPVETIDKIIESMNGRLRQIIDNNGERLKY